MRPEKQNDCSHLSCFYGHLTNLLIALLYDLLQQKRYFLKLISYLITLLISSNSSICPYELFQQIIKEQFSEEVFKMSYFQYKLLYIGIMTYLNTEFNRLKYYYVKYLNDQNTNLYKACVPFISKILLESAQITFYGLHVLQSS